MRKKRPSGPVAPYLPFASFCEALDELSKAPLPNKINATIFRGYSVTFADQLVRAFMFFDLIDAAGKPKPDLEALVDQDKRKARFEELLRRSYAPYLPQDLSRMAPSELYEALEELGVTGSTRQKATTFFAKLAEAADVPIPKIISEATRAPRRRLRTVLDQGAKGHSPRTERRRNLVTTDRIDLKSGGSVTLTINVDPFRWNVEDQHFVTKLISCFNSYRPEKEKLQLVLPQD